MKKLILLVFALMMVVGVAKAREPYGDYVCRYIVTYQNGTCQYYSINNPIKITHQGIQVKNTNAGTKIWATKYQGPIRLTSSGGSERFHNFYLTNQHVEFDISDRPFYTYNGKTYYMIIFDGQVQLAESR